MFLNIRICCIVYIVIVNFYNFLTNDVIMSSLVRTRNIVNWVTTADGCVECVHTADAMQLDSFVASSSAVRIRHNLTAI